ncbi:MAG: trans-sulfuration enzyme family protein [Candidatus Dormibacteria bacterium]
MAVHPETLLARGGGDVSARPAPASPAIVQTSAYAFAGIDDLEATYDGETGAHVYTRHSGENSAALESLMASLEGAAAALACSSGQAASLLALVTLTPPGGRVALAPALYGGTTSLVRNQLTRLGYVACDWDGQLDTVAELAGSTLVVETISNPLMGTRDLAVLSEHTHRAGVRLVVDNTMATPLLCRPLELGADLVVHSATKFLNGHGDLIAGVLAGDAETVSRARGAAIDLGTCLGPFEAWLCLRGLRTLHLRLERQVDNACRLARMLAGHSSVARVHHPSLAPLPPGLSGPGAMLSFDLARGEAGVRALLRAVPGIPLVPSLGDVRTTLSLPARTSHRGLSAGERELLGIGPGLVRVSTGAENPQELMAQFSTGLSAAAAVA